MKPNYRTVINMMSKHVELVDLIWNLDRLGFRLPQLGTIELFDLALDAIGFPPVPQKDRRWPDRDYRYEWRDESYRLKQKDVNKFVEKIYAEYEKLKLAQPNMV
jgi:hypothetical protein